MNLLERNVAERTFRVPAVQTSLDVADSGHLPVVAAIAAMLIAAAQAAYPQSPGFYRPGDVRIDQRLQAELPLDAPFSDETGKSVTLGAYFGKKPVLLNLIFYRCAGV